MDDKILIIGLIVGLPVLWFIFTSAIGFLAPQSYTGPRYLKQQLKKKGIAYQHLPDEFFIDCVTFAEQISRVEGYGSVIKKKKSFVKGLDNMVNMTRWWIDDPNDSMFKDMGEKNSYRKIFEKYQFKK